MVVLECYISSNFKLQEINLPLQLKFRQGLLNFPDKLRMNKVHVILGHIQLLIKENLPNLNLISEIGNNLNKTGQTTPLIFLNQNIHHINQCDNFLNRFLNISLYCFIRLLGCSSIQRCHSVTLLVDSKNTFLCVVQRG